MDKDVQIALIVSIPPTIASVAALIVGLQNKKSVKQVHKLANSNLKRQTKLLQLANEKIEKLLKEKV